MYVSSCVSVRKRRLSARRRPRRRAAQVPPFSGMPPCFDQPAAFHYLLCSEETGQYLRGDGTEGSRADDAAMWTMRATAPGARIARQA